MIEKQKRGEGLLDRLVLFLPRWSQGAEEITGTTFCHCGHVRRADAKTFPRDRCGTLPADVLPSDSELCLMPRLALKAAF